MPDNVLWNNILFYFVFLSQIILISFYFPRKMLKRMKYVLATYPPSQYPKLYPRPSGYYGKMQRYYKNGNLFIFLIGLFFMAALLSDSTSINWDNVVFIYFMIQFLPMMIMEIGSFKYYGLMRKADSRSTRKAELRPRRLFDFISPTLIGLTVFVYFAFIAFILYVQQFDFPWFGGYGNILGMTGGNLFFALIVIWNIYGKKQDPYQAYEDRINQIKLIVNQMVFISIAMTIYITIVIALASLDLRSLEPMIMSLYFQLIAVVGLRTLRIDDINFEVYKLDPSQENNEGKGALQNVEKNSHRNIVVGLWIDLFLGLSLGTLILIEGGTVKGFV